MTYQEQALKIKEGLEADLAHLEYLIKCARGFLNDGQHIRFHDAILELRTLRRDSAGAETKALARLSALDTFDTLLEEKEGTTNQGDTQQC